MKTRKILTMLTVMMLVGTMTGCGTNADLKETGKAEKQETIDKSKEQDKLAHLDAEEKTAEKETADKSAESKNKAEKESDKKTAETSSKDETKSETAKSSTQETVKETNSSNTVSNQNTVKTETSKETLKAPVNNTSAQSNKAPVSSNKNEENKNTSSNSNKTPTQTNKQQAKEETKKPAVENTKPAHTHSWVEVTEKYTIPAKTHEETVYKTESYEIEPARDEEVLVFLGQECVDCGYRTSINNEMNLHMIENAHSCTTVKEYETVHHEAVYGERKVPNGTKVVVDEPEKTGTRVTGYKCSCGATKNK